MLNWVRFHEEGDFNRLVQVRRDILPSAEIVLEQWRCLCNEYYERYGMSQEFKEYLQKIVKLTVLYCDNAEKFDSVKHMRIQIMEEELKVFRSVENVNFFESNAILSEFMGFAIDPSKTTVPEYQGYISHMKKVLKQRKAKQNGKKT